MPAPEPDWGRRTRRIVADADVLAADLLVGGAARDALDVVRGHSWLTLLASAPLVADAEAVIADLADGRLAADWRATVEDLAEPVEHPAGDHPGLASAYHGEAGHLLTCDERLLTARAGATVRGYAAISVRRPDAFVRVVDPAAIYPGDGEYPGPDRDPRA